MVARAFSWILFVAAVVGVAFALRETAIQRKLLPEYQRLASQWGDLELSDPLKVHVLALETNDPLHFAWRMYIPPDARARWEWKAGSERGSTHGSSSLGSSSIPTDCICRVRFRKDVSRGWQVFTTTESSASLSSVNEELAQQLDQRLSGLRVQRAGVDKTEVTDSETIIELLCIDRDSTEAASPPSGSPRELSSVGVLYRFGLEQAFRLEKQKGP